MDQAISLIERSGLPTTALLFLVYALCKGGKWAGTRLLCEENGILTLLAGRGVRFLDALQDTTQRQAENTANNTELLKSMAAIYGDPTSPVSTVQTNRALIHLAELLDTMAKHQGVDVSAHVAAIRAALTARNFPTA